MAALWWIDDLEKLRKEQRAPAWEPEQLQLPEYEPSQSPSDSDEEGTDSRVVIIEDP
jgi:hypothetical protein